MSEDDSERNSTRNEGLGMNEKTVTEFSTWMDEAKYLPPPMRDFHDQKQIFKAMHDLIEVDKHAYAKDVSWVVGQCYVIDVFLWFMAKRGYTLQRSRAKFAFRDLGKDVETSREAFANSTRNVMLNSVSESSS